MNIEQAKQIPIAEILNKLGCNPTQVKNNESWYLSPFRNEKTASFKVNHIRNVWYDHGEGIGGDSITLVCRHLKNSDENYSVPDALRWIKNMLGYAPRIQPIDDSPVVKRDPTFKKVCVKTLTAPSLIRYLDSRGFPFAFAEKHLKQVRIHNNETDKKSDLIGFRNEDGGFELRSKSFKGSVGKKYPSFIRGKKGGPGGGIHIFEGWPDYLSALIQQNDGETFDDDTFVLNSLAFLPIATPFIKGYGYSVAYSWMDNDEAGKKATQNLDEFFKTEDGLLHKPMNSIYAPHKDVNAWHMAKLGLAG